MRHAGCRNENARYAKLGAVTDAMGRAGAAISEQYEIARIVAASDRDFAQRVRHVSVDHPADTGGGFFYAHAERFRDLLADSFSRGLKIELHAAAEKIVRRQDAEHEIGVGGARAAAPIANRARRGAG